MKFVLQYKMMNGTISEKKKKRNYFSRIFILLLTQPSMFWSHKIATRPTQRGTKKGQNQNWLQAKPVFSLQATQEDMDHCKHGAIYISLRSISCITPHSVSFAVQILMAAFLLEHVQNEGAQSQMMSSLTIPHSPGTPASLPMLPWLLHSPLMLGQHQ